MISCCVCDIDFGGEVDLGAAPGGWSVAASKIIDKKKNGYLVGIDLLSYAPIPGYPSITGDFQSRPAREQLTAILDGRMANVVLSDMLHNVTGHRPTDHSRSMGLVHDALDFCEYSLKPQGKFFAKFLKGSEENELFERSRSMFATVKFVKPKASRSESNEMFILCLDKRDL